MFNSITIMGRLVADPELKQTTNNKLVTTFTVAVERSYSKNGEKDIDYIDVVAWDKKAEHITKYFKKGSMILVQGSLQIRSYTDGNGIRRKAAEITAKEISFCGGKAEKNPYQNQAETESDSDFDDVMELR